MSVLLNSRAFLGVIWRRILSRLGLMFAVWTGLTLAVALVVSIPMYAEATGYRILQAALAAASHEDPLPPFSMTYRYEGSSGPSITWQQYKQVDKVGSDLAASGIDLPTQRKVRYAATDRLRVVPPGADNEGFTQTTLARLAFLSGFQDNVQLLEGDWPKPYTGKGPVDVLVSETEADQRTILVDDVYTLHTSPGSMYDLNLPVHIAGIWRPANPESDYWFYPPSTFNPTLILPETSFKAVLDEPSVPWISYMAWYTALDGGAVHSSDIPGLLGRIRATTDNLGRLLPGIELSRSPTEALVQHGNQVRVLTITLVLFSVPLLGLLWFFVVQVARMVVERQRQEIALLRSRGSSRLEVIGLALGEGLALCIAAVLAGLPLGLATAQLMVSTQSFLHFTPLPGRPVELLAASWRQGALVMAVALPAILAPALRASDRTIISFKQERSRTTHKPLWKRLFLDLLLLVAALYGYQQLRLRGMIDLPGVAPPADDPLRNPLLLLAPALFVLALALLTLRVLPLLLALLGRALSRTRGISLLTLRFLSRDPRAYSGPILLITLTLSLAAFTASMARTLDEHTYARGRYTGGPDIRLAYAPVVTDSTSLGAGASGASTSGPVSAETGVASSVPTDQSMAAANIDYLFVPADDYLDIPGVRAVSRVASSDVFMSAAGGSQTSATFLGVDRTKLPPVLADSWRSDYASESLGTLMNRLAGDPSAALVSSRYAAENGLRVGDRVTLRMNDLGETTQVPFLIAGTVDYFPTLYTENGPFIIGNLDYSFETQGDAYPYEIWLDLAPGANVAPIRSEAYGFSLSIQKNTPQSLIRADILRPERQGLFGLLSVGFLAAALVTVIGFLAHTLLSFRRRLVEMGTLRAIGLSTWQLASLLVWEQALVIGAGTGVGTALGVLASRMFVPFLQVRAGEFPDTPPFIVQIAWSQILLVYVVTGALLLITVGITLALLRRMRIFEAVKLGETV